MANFSDGSFFISLLLASYFPPLTRFSVVLDKLLPLADALPIDAASLPLSRSWPWKKRSSEKSAAEKAIATLDAAGVSSASGESQNDKDNYKKPKYVQILVEHLSGLEDQVKTEDQVQTYEGRVKTCEEQLKTYKEQVKTYEEQVKTYEDQLKTLDVQIDELNEQLSDAHTEMNNKEELVKQHAKVAEEDVSGWERDEAEAATLKTYLEAVTLSKLTTEDRAAHLDNALKECTRQIRNLKEGHKKKVQDVVITKNMQYDKMENQRERDLRRSEWMRKMEEAMNKPSSFLHFLEAPEEATQF